ncbi:MAG TPA: STAS domain-containing protein [Candidatus Eisenbacteria bacterium]
MKETYATKHAHVRRAGGTVVLKPHGDLMGGPETDELEKLLTQFDGEGLPCLVVNLYDVSMMNSLAIGRLIGAHLAFKKRGAHMSLCNVDKRIQNIFVITKLAFEFNLYGSEEEAIARCATSDE